MTNTLRSVPEAIRWAYREYFQHLKPDATNRTFDPDKDQYNFKDETFDPTKYIDDDLFGYMDAKKGSDNKDATTKRRGVLEVSRAISLDPYWGDVVFGSKAELKAIRRFTIPKSISRLINIPWRSHPRA
jgi:CRISPR-associated protein Cst2